MPDRRRRRTRNHPARRRRRRLLIALAAAALVIAAFGALLAIDVLAARRALTTARAEVRSMRTALLEGEVERARSRLADAERELERADQRTNRLLWRGGEEVPLVGRSLVVVRVVVDVADAAVAVADEALERAAPLIERGPGALVRVRDGRVDLEPLRAASEDVGAIELGRLRRARDTLAATPGTWLPGEVRAGRREALDLADAAIGSLERGGLLLDALPDFLGAGGRRRYFLAMQNNAELRGTGGLVGEFAVLRVDGGSFALEEVQPIRALDRDAAGRQHVAVDAEDTFVSRYGHAGGNSFARSVNLDPDLPTVAPVLLDLYRQRTGERLDGVVVVDPVALGAILAPIGPLRLAPEAVEGAPGMPNPVPPERIAEVAMIDAVEAFGQLEGGTSERKQFLSYLAEAAFGRILAGDWDPVQVGSALARTAGERHLQLFSTQPDEQQAFERVGVAGAMRAEPGWDLLAVTANNAAGNKQDVHVGHLLEGDIHLSPPERGARRDASLTVSLDNPLPSSGMDPTILGSLPTDVGTGREFQRVDGLNRTWFTVWGPVDTEFRSARTADGRPLNTVTWALHGHRAVDHFLETPSRSTSGFAVEGAGPVAFRRDGPDLVYRLRLWRQAKAIADGIDLTIVAPAGWDVAEAVVTGGGGGGGLGPRGEPGPAVTASIENGRVRVRGDATSDVDVEVRFSRSLWDRFRRWLSESAW